MVVHWYGFTDIGVYIIADIVFTSVKIWEFICYPYIKISTIIFIRYISTKSFLLFRQHNVSVSNKDAIIISIIFIVIST